MPYYIEVFRKRIAPMGPISPGPASLSSFYFSLDLAMEDAETWAKSGRRAIVRDTNDESLRQEFLPAPSLRKETMQLTGGSWLKLEFAGDKLQRIYHSADGAFVHTNSMCRDSLVQLQGILNENL